MYNLDTRLRHSVSSAKSIVVPRRAGSIKKPKVLVGGGETVEAVGTGKKSQPG